MRVQPGTIDVVRFSTDGLAPRERGPALRGLYERSLAHFEPLSDGSAHVAISKRFLPSVHVLAGTLGGLRQFGTRPATGAGEAVFLAVNLSGESLVRQKSREINVRSGDAVFFAAETGVVLNRPTPVELVAIRLPGKTLAPLLGEPGDDAARLIPGETPALRLLVGYLRALDSEPAALESPDLRQAVAIHICDLLALSVGANREAIDVAEQRGARAARLQAIKTDIGRNLGDCELNVTEIALRHGITPRYVQRLFASEGKTFSEHVLERRLALARRLLTDLRLAHRPVTSIAFDAGFSDLSYFNRTFRRRFEATPTEVRAMGNADARAS
jgi:AraC-like DNA-binding protein